MIDMLLRDGDLVADKYGDISLCIDESEDIIQTANHNILLRYGTNKFHKELGNLAYNNRVKANEGGIQIIQEECINAVLNDSRIREVKELNVTLLADGACLVDYVLVYAKTIETTIEEDDIDDTPSDPELDAVDILEVQEEVEDILIEVDGRSYVGVFNI